MALLLSPDRVIAAARGAVRAVARRVLGITPAEPGELRKVSDDLPRDSVFEQPLVVTAEVLGDVEAVDGGKRVTFRVTVKDAVGKRCPDIHVEVRVVGPERTAVGEATTDMLGGARFRMSGPPGEYELTVLEVAALALRWDREASTTTAVATVR